MTANTHGSVLNINLAVRLAAAIAMMTVALAAISVQPAFGQSAGCTDGPYDGATALDSDGDGVSDGDEIAAGTNECDPGSTPSPICGTFVANYDASTADSDGDTFTDSDETVAGSDPCDGTSVIAAAAAPAATPAQAAPQLALTGPSSSLIGVLLGISALLLGAVALVASRRTATTL